MGSPDNQQPPPKSNSFQLVWHTESNLGCRFKQQKGQMTSTRFNKVDGGGGTQGGMRKVRSISAEELSKQQEWLCITNFSHAWQKPPEAESWGIAEGQQKWIKDIQKRAIICPHLHQHWSSSKLCMTASFVCCGRTALSAAYCKSKGFSSSSARDFRQCLG